MPSGSVTTLVLLAASATLGPRGALGHEHHFKGHPEWDHLWPEPPTVSAAQGFPDLSGVWHGSPLGGEDHRYFFTQAGGGYGTAKDAGNPSRSPTVPGTTYDVVCLTSDWRGGKPGGCGWTRANVTLAAGPGGKGIVGTATFDNGGTLSGPLSADGCNFAMSAPWNRFCGDMSGLWRGPTGSDFYVMAHNETTGNLSVWWDTDMTPVGTWSYGRGEINASRFLWIEYAGVGTPFNLSGTSPIGSGNTSWGWVRRQQQFFPSPIHTVHMVFMNHLDVGYASFINNIDNEYFHEYYPGAINIANAMRALEGTDRFIYVTHTWLMSFFLSCPCSDTNSTTCPALTLNNPYAEALQCPTPQEVAALRKALSDGDIVWHAAPFNVEAEAMAGPLFEAGIRQVQNYDKMFYGENRTITMSDRDVIYVTRSVIPLLAKYGIKGLTIGSNGANYPPQVPKLHLWRDEATNTEVIVAYHPYGYGGYGKSTCAGPGQCGDCAEAPNGVALCTEFRTDNSGPPKSTDEVIASLDAVRAEYPKASVFASTFDNFIRDVLPVKDQLPVVTKEVGDTWIYGVPSDPLKMAQNREIQRAWIECLNAGKPECDYANPTIVNMTRFLMKAPEHTWGIPGISGWGGGDDYNKTKFQGDMNSSAYLHASSTWAEQRFYNELAVRALEHDNHPLAASVRQRVDALAGASAPDLSGFTKSASSSTSVDLGGVSVAFDASGAINHLAATGSSSVDWASSNATLAGFVYHTLNETEWKPFTYDYINGHGEAGGFCKPGSNNYSESRHWRPTLQAVYSKGNTAVAVLVMPARASSAYGSPGQVFLNVTASLAGSSLVCDLTVTWIGKSPVMIGESTSLMFTPRPPLTKPGAWALDKLGFAIDPENVQDGGNQYNHAVWDGATAKTEAGTMHLVSLDAPNMLPMTPQYPYGWALPAGSDGLKQLAVGSVSGMAVNLHNNLWNTNYPLYYPYYDPMYCTSPWECKNANQSFRFRLTLQPSA